MTDATHDTTARGKPGPMLAADGTPLKRSLARALRMQKIRALLLIAPLLLFVLVTFIAPIADMLFRSVENDIVANTLPDTVEELASWDGASGETPSEAVYQALYFDLFIAAEAKEHTKLGTRLNYEQTGISSLFRSTGRNLDDLGKDYQKTLKKIDKSWDDGAFWYALMSGEGGEEVLESHRLQYMQLIGQSPRSIISRVWCVIRGIFYKACPTALEDIDLNFTPSAEAAQMLPATVAAYSDFAVFTVLADGDVVAEEDPWEAVYAAFAQDLNTSGTVDKIQSYSGPGQAELLAVTENLADLPAPDFKTTFLDIDKDWGKIENWQTIKIYSPKYTSGYFLNSVDLMKTPEGIDARPENQRIYLKLFKRTLFMSLVITGSCILLGYPVAWILANLPARKANLLMILVLLPFWTSLLVRTSAWKIMLQQQGVINDTLVWLGLVADGNRLVMINNQFGTIVAMTHILLPFMILPMYSVMQTIPPTYLRAAKSLGATNWTAFWRVYFPQTVPGIGAGSILVFILSIGYYITPEIVGGTTGTFISNRIAYHISSSLNWGLAAALGTILLGVVLLLYWAYDRIVGIDNVKLG